MMLQNWCFWWTELCPLVVWQLVRQPEEGCAGGLRAPLFGGAAQVPEPHGEQTAPPAGCRLHLPAAQSPLPLLVLLPGPSQPLPMCSGTHRWSRSRRPMIRVCKMFTLRVWQVSWHWRSIVELDQLWMAKCLRLGWCITFSPSAFEQGVWKRHYIETVLDLQRRLLQVRGFSYMWKKSNGAAGLKVCGVFPDTVNATGACNSFSHQRWT